MANEFVGLLNNIFSLSEMVEGDNNSSIIMARFKLAADAPGLIDSIKQVMTRGARIFLLPTYLTSGRWMKMGMSGVGFSGGYIKVKLYRNVRYGTTNVVLL